MPEEEGFQSPTNPRNRNPINHNSSSLVFIIKVRVITKNLYSIFTMQIILPCKSKEAMLHPMALNWIVNAYPDICPGIYILFFTGLHILKPILFSETSVQRIFAIKLEVSSVYIVHVQPIISFFRTECPFCHQVTAELEYRSVLRCLCIRALHSKASSDSEVKKVFHAWSIPCPPLICNTIAWKRGSSLSYVVITDRLTSVQSKWTADTNLTVCFGNKVYTYFPQI